MGELVKKADVSTELAKVNAGPPTKLFKHSNYAPFVLETPAKGELAPVIDRDAWIAESAEAGYFASVGFSAIGLFFIAVPFVGPLLDFGTVQQPAALFMVIFGFGSTTAGFYNLRRHISRLRWVKQTSARRIRAWLSAAYNLHVPELEPKLAERFLNRNVVGATLALVDEVGRAFTLYRVAANQYALRDAQHEVLAQLPTTEPPAALVAGQGQRLQTLPRGARALHEAAAALHTTLAAKAGLSPEHEHRVARAGDVLAEIASLTAALTKRPTAAYVQNVEAALSAITRDMEEIKDELDAALSRQAEVLAAFTREVTGK